MSQFTVSMILSLVDRATGPLRAVTAKMREAGAAAKTFDAAGRIKTLQAGRRALAGQALALGATAFAFQRALQPALKFESAMADVNKVVDFQGEGGLASLSGAILDLSTRLPIAAEGIAAIVAAAGQANLIDAALPDAEKRAQLVAFAESAGKMGVAFDIGAAEAGEAMAGLRNVFGLSQARVERLADAINHLSNNMAATAPKIVSLMNRIGAIGTQFGLAEEQTAALSSAFLALQIEPDRAGTAIKTMLGMMLNAKDQTKEFHGALKELGTNAARLKKDIGQDAAGALLGFLEKVRNSGDALSILTRLFGRDSAAEIATLTGSLDQLRRSYGLTGDDMLFAGSMQAEFAARSATTENKLELLRNKLSAVAIMLGTAVLPALGDLADRLGPLAESARAFAEANPELVAALAAIAAGLLALEGAAILIKLLFGTLAIAALRLFSALRMVAVLGLPLVANAILALGAVLLSTPLGVAFALIASAAAVIVANWAPIERFFLDLWAGIKSAFADAWSAISPIVDKATAAARSLGLIGGDGGAPQRPAGNPQGLLRRIPGRGMALPETGDFDPLAFPPDRFGGFRRLGGAVRAGMGYVVGEDGPEFFAPGVSGRVARHSELLAMAAIPLDRRGPGGFAPGAGPRGATLSIGAIHVHAAPGMDARALADLVIARIRDAARGGRDLHDGAYYGGAV